MTIPPETIPPETIPADVKALAVLVVRDGQLPAGADETVAEAGGAALVAGSGTEKAADGLDAASRVWLLEVSSVAPAALAGTLAQALTGVDMILLPASPDGRDLAPRLAVILGRPLLAGAVRCAPGEVEVTRLDDRLSVRVGVDGPVLVTLRPGLRGTLEPLDGTKSAQVSALSLAAPQASRDAASRDPPAVMPPAVMPPAVMPPAVMPRASRCCSPSPEWWTWPRLAGSWAAAPAWCRLALTGRR